MDLAHINAYTKFYKNSCICSEDIEEKHIFYINQGSYSVVYKQIQPICNPKPLLPDTNVHAKFEEIRQKLLKLESRNEARTDGWADSCKQYNIIPRHFLCGGV